LVLGAAVPVLADGGGGDPPLCRPGSPQCPIKITTLGLNGPGQPPLCYPGEPRCPGGLAISQLNDLGYHLLLNRRPLP